MNNEEWQLAKFIVKHPEYSDEYKAGNLSLNLFCDILRKNPREVIAVSDLPHNLDLVGYKLANNWEITDSRAKELKSTNKHIKEKSKGKRYEQSL